MLLILSRSDGAAIAEGPLSEVSEIESLAESCGRDPSCGYGGTPGRRLIPADRPLPHPFSAIPHAGRVKSPAPLPFLYSDAIRQEIRRRFRR